MIAPLTIDAAVQALADEEAWLAESPERCAACGHRECFHAVDRCDDIVCIVDGCYCENGKVVVDSSEAPVPGVYGETVFASGATSASTLPLLTIVSLGGSLPEPPDIRADVVFGTTEKGSLMTDRDTRLAAIRARAHAAIRGAWEDADFIAHARSDVPWLLVQVDELAAWSGANAERGAWSRAWALLTGESEYGGHSDAAIVQAARRMLERAEKAEAGLRRLQQHHVATRAQCTEHARKTVEGEPTCAWCDVERLDKLIERLQGTLRNTNALTLEQNARIAILESENESLQKDLAQAQEDHRSSERAQQEQLDDLAQLVCPVDGKDVTAIEEGASCVPPIATEWRGHCGRCHRCGSPLASSVMDGCTSWNCSMRPMPEPRSHCAGCGAPYADGGT